MRIVIIGGPRAGKSTLGKELAEEYGIPLYCTDPMSKVKDVEEGVNYLPENTTWTDQSAFICLSWLTKENFVIEGVSSARALRKWKELYKEMPCDSIIVLDKAVVGRSKGQEAMSKGVFTVWDEIKDYYEPLSVSI